jgi:hypothetical protein
MRAFRIRRLVVATIVTAGVLAPAGAALANDYFVSTTGNDANTCDRTAAPCLTIQAAVNKAPDGSQICVSAGTYAGSIAINGRASLNIIGSGDVLLVPPAVPGPNQSHVISIYDSRQIQFENVTIQGHGDADGIGGLAASDSSGIRLREVTVQNMGGGGVVLYRNASAQITNSAVRRNRNHGLRVDASSEMLIGSPNPSETVVIEDNPYQGIAVSGTVSLRGNVVLRGNAYGVFGNGGRLNSCCGEGTVSVVDNTSQGFRMTGGYMDLRGPVLVEGHPQGGIRLIGTTAYLNLWNDRTIVLRNNGNAGIHLSGSHLEGAALDITDNPGRGMLLEDASSARIYDITISGNGQEGIRVDGHSVIRVLAPATVNGNGRADLWCSRNSSGVGDPSLIGRLQCADFEKLK